MRGTAWPALAIAAGLSLAVDAAAQDALTIDRNRLDRQTAETPEPDALLAPQPTAPAFAPFVLRAVAVQGSRLGEERIQQVVQPFIGQTLDMGGVARLRAALAQAYEDTDFALPIVALDLRRAHEGVVVITAVEGRIAHLNIRGDVDGDVEILRRYAQRLTAEAPLTRPTAERYLSLISDVPGVRTTLEHSASAQTGTVDLGLNVERTRWAFDLGFTNRGSQRLGRNQITAGATLNGAFRMGDQTRFSLTAPTDWDRFQYLTLSHRQPLGYDGAAITASIGHLRTRLPDGVSGEADSLGVVVSWPAIRSYRANLTLSGSLDGVNSDNAVFGDLVSTEKTRVLRASAAWSQVGPRSTLAVSGVLSQGLDGLGAEPGLLAEADFTKANLRLGMARAVGQSVRVSLSVSAQITDDALPNSELFGLGGDEFGRAFSSALLVGDSGYGARAEVAWRPGFTPQAVRGSEVYVFGDGGEATVNDRPPFIGTTRSLASAGLGARIAMGRRVVLEIEGAKAVDDPRPADGDDWRLGFQLTGRF